MTDIQHTLSLIKKTKGNMKLLKLARSVALESKQNLNFNVLKSIHEHTDILIQLYGEIMYWNIVLPEQHSKDLK